MKILLRDYLLNLGESNELEVLVADLLLNMQIEPHTKPQKGVRQDGVDISAVGIDPGDGEEKLFLITIKAGNITRSDWDGNSNAVRPSLNEIKDVYLKRRVDNSHQDLPKKIILCCGGILKQEVDANWKAYTEDNSKPGQLEYALWTGDKLALEIEKYFLDEYLFPKKNQSLMRKALALLDQNEQEPIFFYSLVEQILFESGLTINTSKIKHLKALRLVSLCLGVVARWSLELENTRPALLCAERTLLRTWDFLRQHGLLDHRAGRKVYVRLYEQYLEIALAYTERIRPVCLIEDGLANSSLGADTIEYPLRALEIIGFLSTFGISDLTRSYEVDRYEHEEGVHIAADTLTALIMNNPAAISPRYDDHAIEIALGLLLLFTVNYTDAALEWMKALTYRVTRAYGLGNRFPVVTDSYEDLLDMEFGRNSRREQLMSLSTLLPTIAEWYAVIGEQGEYTSFREAVNTGCRGINLQLWYPDSETESLLYKENAGYDTGATCHSISLPEDIDVLRDTMRGRLEEQTSFFQLSCIKHDFPALGLIASRHFRTPVIPAYWQRLGANNNGTSNVQDPSEKDTTEDDLPIP